MHNGWIKLHRQFKDSQYYGDPNFVAFWVHLLLSATTEPKEIIFRGKKITVPAGTVITTRKKLAAETGLSEATIERNIKRTANDTATEQQTDSHFRLIYIKNWNQYQVSGQESDSKRTANGHYIKKENKKENKNLLVDGEPVAADNSKDKIFYDTFVALCGRRGLSVEIPLKKYCELKSEYELKLIWWPQVQRCVNWLYDNGKKTINSQRLRNWMVKSIEINKEKEIKARQEIQDKKFSNFKKPITPSQIPVWTPPL